MTTDKKRYQDVSEPVIFRIAVMKLHVAYSIMKQYVGQIGHKKAIIQKKNEKQKQIKKRKSSKKNLSNT